MKTEFVYTVERPKPGPVIWLLSTLVIIGLGALTIAAYRAFAQVMPFYQAGFAAMLIEAGLVSESIALVRGKNWIAVIGLIIGLAVSATYNYIQVQSAGINSGLTNPWQLITLALGPLSALLVISLSLGAELRKYQQHQDVWQMRRQAAYQRWQRRQMSRQMSANQPAKSDKTTNGGQTSANVTANLPATPTFDRGYAGYLQFDAWMSANGRQNYEPLLAAQIMKRSVRQIQRYIERKKLDALETVENAPIIVRASANIPKNHNHRHPVSVGEGGIS